MGRNCLPGFYEAACGLVAHSQADAGCSRFEVQRELPWAGKVSNNAHLLFIIRQEWQSPEHLEAHVKSQHALRFNKAITDGEMLVCEPRLSIFGNPLGEAELLSMAKANKKPKNLDGKGLPPLPKGGANASLSGYKASEAPAAPASRPDSRESGSATRRSVSVPGGGARVRNSSKGTAWK